MLDATHFFSADEVEPSDLFFIINFIQEETPKEATRVLFGTRTHWVKSRQ